MKRKQTKEKVYRILFTSTNSNVEGEFNEVVHVKKGEEVTFSSNSTYLDERIEVVLSLTKKEALLLAEEDRGRYEGKCYTFIGVGDENVVKFLEGKSKRVDYLSFENIKIHLNSEQILWGSETVVEKCVLLGSNHLRYSSCVINNSVVTEGALRLTSGLSIIDSVIERVVASSGALRGGEILNSTINSYDVGEEIILREHTITNSKIISPRLLMVNLREDAMIEGSYLENIHFKKDNIGTFGLKENTIVTNYEGRIIEIEIFPLYRRRRYFILEGNTFIAKKGGEIHFSNRESQSHTSSLLIQKNKFQNITVSINEVYSPLVIQNIFKGETSGLRIIRCPAVKIEENIFNDVRTPLEFWGKY